jgi:hypothetical protein
MHTIMRICLPEMRTRLLACFQMDISSRDILQSILISYNKDFYYGQTCIERNISKSTLGLKNGFRAYIQENFDAKPITLLNQFSHRLS